MRESNPVGSSVTGLINILKTSGLLPPNAKLTTGRTSKRKAYRPDDLLRPNEAARVLKVRTKTLANWRVRGEGPRFIKSGRLVTYQHADLVAFIRQCRRSSTSEASNV